MSSKKRDDPFERFNRLIDKVKRRNLPDDFHDWTLSGPDGWTIAHQAAVCEILPYDFDNLELADNSGYTVAHVLAALERLPESFDKWELSDNDGWTVAHEAANTGPYPPTLGAKQWGLKDNRGLTALDIYKNSIDELYEEYSDRLYFANPDKVFAPLLEFKELLGENDDMSHWSSNIVPKGDIVFL